MNVLRYFLCIFFLLEVVLHAESNTQIKGLENEANHLQKRHMNGNEIGRLTPCAGPRVKNGVDVYLFADFIYWTAKLDTLTYAKTGGGSLPNIGETKKGTILSVDWSWDPGFKTGIGWNFCHGCWDMNLQYTWLYTNAGGSKASSTLLPSYDIFPSEIISNSILLNRAYARFDLHYQVGDLELGRSYYVSRTLKLRPFIGVKGTWQKQDYALYYDSIPITQLNDLFNFRAKFNQAIWGLGMRGGLYTFGNSRNG